MVTVTMVCYGGPVTAKNLVQDCIKNLEKIVYRIVTSIKCLLWNPSLEKLTIIIIMAVICDVTCDHVICRPFRILMHKNLQTNFQDYTKFTV